jgi:GNAT superfamily N-acetyltransferase
MIRCLLHDSFYKYTKTCKRKWWKDFGVNRYSTRDTENYNLFYEFWEGRRFLGAMYGTNFYEGSNEIYLDHLFVTEKLREKGYGTYMIDYLKKKYKYIYVESIDEAVGFYRKLGFTKNRDQSHRIYDTTIDMTLTIKKKRK